MRGPLLVFLGAFGVLFAGCSSACLFVVGFETATHPQSPIRHWPMKPGESVKDELLVDQAGYASKGVTVELARYEGPYKIVPIACSLHVRATQGSNVTTRESTAPKDRPGHCTVDINAAGATRLGIEASNDSERDVLLTVTPELPGFPRPFKAAWLALMLVGAGGLLGITKGVGRWKRDRAAG